MSDLRTKLCQECHKEYIEARDEMEKSRLYVIQQCQYSRIRPDTAICKLVRETCFPKDYIEEVKEILQVQKHE